MAHRLSELHGPNVASVVQDLVTQHIVSNLALGRVAKEYVTQLVDVFVAGLAGVQCHASTNFLREGEVASMFNCFLLELLAPLDEGQRTGMLRPSRPVEMKVVRNAPRLWRRSVEHCNTGQGSNPGQPAIA